jgi:hypothetical protein
MKIVDIKEPVELNESQRNLLRLALDMAAQQFVRDAEAVGGIVVRALEGVTGMDDLRSRRLGQQFREQARDAQDLAERLELSVWVRFGPVEE